MRFTVASGQASVELVAVLPLLAAGVLAAGQAVVAVHAGWAASQAAEAAARAHAVGEDVRRAARGALPGHLERGLRVREQPTGEVRIRLAVPSLLPALDLGSVSGRARFEPQS